MNLSSRLFVAILAVLILGLGASAVAGQTHRHKGHAKASTTSSHTAHRATGTSGRSHVMHHATGFPARSSMAGHRSSAYGTGSHFKMNPGWNGHRIGRRGPAGHGPMRSHHPSKRHHRKKS